MYTIRYDTIGRHEGDTAGAAGLAMVIAFANLAGLLIVRSIDRRRELAVRSALGARRSEMARQLLLEAVALVTMGTLAGGLLAFWMTPAVARLALEQFGGLANRDVAVSWGLIGALTIVAFACASICGLLAALGTARWNVVDVLRRGATASPRELTLRRVFVAGEITFAFEQPIGRRIWLAARAQMAEIIGVVGEASRSR